MFVMLALVLICWGIGFFVLDQRRRHPAPKLETVKAQYVVNAAGLYSDKVAAMVGDTSFKVKPRLGEYLLMRRPAINIKEEPAVCRHVVFPCPGKMGKGILVQPTLWGNACLGPTAIDGDRKTAEHHPSRGESKAQIISGLLATCRQLIPAFDESQIIHSFAGVRAKTDRGDWIVEASPVSPRIVYAAGIDSPGLAGSPAVALAVVDILKTGGLKLAKNLGFDPRRKPYIIPKDNWRMWDPETKKKVAIKKDSPDPRTNVICRCELVTEAEVVDAVKRGRTSTLACDSTQAVRKRTRAGMGWCQGQYCEPRVRSIISRETGRPLSAVEVRQWPESSLLENRHQYADKQPK